MIISNTMSQSRAQKDHKNDFEAESAHKGLRTENIFGVEVASTHMPQVLELISDIVTKPCGNPYQIITINPEFFVQLWENPEFARVVKTADLVIPDGKGLKLENKNLQEIIPGRVLVEKLLKDRKYKVFFLGGKDGVAEEMAKRFGGEWDEGAQDIKSEILNSKDQINANNQILNKINDYEPDLLLVAYGAPWQELWIDKYKDQINAKIAMGVGGTFDYLTGRTKVPPKTVSNAGFEWLWRLVNEPWRWKRQLKGLKFFARVLKSKF